MEADWSVEIGKDLPVIVAPWEGFVDLRHDAAAVNRIAEADGNPALIDALTKLNASGSPVFTSKCDFWTLTADEIDPFEFDATSEEAQGGIACYLDMLARDPLLYASFPLHESWVRSVTFALRECCQPQVRVEFVVRPAVTENTGEGYGITLYVWACAAREVSIKERFRAALQTATDITMKKAAPAGE